MIASCVSHRGHISLNYYQNIERAKASPPVSVLLSLADALGVWIGDLFDEAPPRSSRAAAPIHSMRAIELLGHVDEQHRLYADMPDGWPAGLVRVLVLFNKNEPESAGG